MKENHRVESLETLSKGAKRKLIRRSNSHTQRPQRSWHLGPIQALLAIGSLAFASVIFLLLIQDIHPAPAKLTLQKDAAELARLETQLRLGNSHTETRSLPSAAVPNAGTERVDGQPEEYSEFQAAKSTLIASRMTTVDRKRGTGSGAVKKHLRAFRRDLERRPDYIRNLQSQRAIASTRQQYKQQGLGSFFSGMGRTLGFSIHRGPL